MRRERNAYFILYMLRFITTGSYTFYELLLLVTDINHTTVPASEDLGLPLFFQLI